MDGTVSRLASLAPPREPDRCSARSSIYASSLSRGSSTRQLLAIQVDTPRRGSTQRIRTTQIRKNPISGSSWERESLDMECLLTLPQLYLSEAQGANRRPTACHTAERRLPPTEQVAVSGELRCDGLSGICSALVSAGPQVCRSGRSTYRSNASGFANASLFLTSCPWITLRIASSTFLPLMV